MPSVDPRFVFWGRPSYFRACCSEASRGGASGYHHPGHELARHLDGEIPYTAEDEEWEAECELLYALVRCDDRDGAERWFVEHFPKCMVLVPRRRRSSFLDGVFAMLAEFDIFPEADAAELHEGRRSR
jgi:hypothetical protein